MPTDRIDMRIAPTVPLRDDEVSSLGHESCRVAGRYELLAQIGRGGFGAVYRGLDALTGHEVAVKLLHPRDESDERQFRAEVSLLRLLRLPNLVHLLDDGTHEGQRFLVTELVDGLPFPGLPSPCSWSEIEAAATGLIKAIARVHAYGVVHRDLKPDNVLVRPDATSVILDFGVSFGPGFSRDGEAERIVGTPAFLAPEQVTGARADVRSDLYAVGVILYEALSGEVPHHGATLKELFRAKLNTQPVSLSEMSPDTPAHVAATVDALLHPSPIARPPNAAAVLHMLGVAPAAHALPWLGKDTPIAQAVSRLLAGRSVRTEGASGLGHSRVHREVAERLRINGTDVWHTRASRHRWGSLPTELRARLTRVTEASPAAICAELEHAQDRGIIVLADDAERLDPDTREALLASGIPTLWSKLHEAHAGDATVVALTPLQREDLRMLFHGPDLLLHLRDDASRLACERTAGYPKRLMQLLEAWVDTGLCYWDAGKLRIGREAIGRLESGLRVLPEHGDADLADEDSQVLSWVTLAGTTASRELLSGVLDRPHDALSTQIEILIAEGKLAEDPDGTLRAQSANVERMPIQDTERRQAHWAIGDASTPGTPGRLFHLIQAHDGERVVAEAQHVAEEALSSGELLQAFAALREAIAFVRLGERREDEAKLLRWLTLIALERQSPRELDIALYEVERGQAVGEAVGPLARLLDVTRLVRYVQRDSERALSAARSIAPFADDPRLEKWRRAALSIASSAGDLFALLQLAQEHLRWAQGCGEPAIVSSVQGWVGLALYRLERYTEAARCHEVSAAASANPLARAVSLTNAASAWLEAGEYDDATQSAEEAFRIADAHRLELVGCRALWLRRSIQTRFDRPPARDPDLEDVYRSVADADHFAAKAYEVEAVAAWRRNDFAEALRFAATAEERFTATRNLAGRVLMRALRHLVGAPLAQAEADALLADANTTFDSVRVQVLALLAPDFPTARVDLRALLPRLRTKARTLRWEILSHAECESIEHQHSLK